VLLHNYLDEEQFLLDLQNQAIVGHYHDRGRRRVYPPGKMDGQSLLEIHIPPNESRIEQISFPTPTDGPRISDDSILYPGADVTLNVSSSLIDRAVLQQEFSDYLQELGFVMNASSPRRVDFTMSSVTVRSKQRVTGGKPAFNPSSIVVLSPTAVRSSMNKSELCLWERSWLARQKLAPRPLRGYACGRRFAPLFTA